MNPRFPFHLLIWLLPMIIFDVVIRAMSLWRSSRRGEKGWFIALFAINSLGILPLIYLLTHSAEKSKSTKK